MAVIRIGISRSCAPRSMASRKSVTPSTCIRCWMCDTSMMPLRVAMPNSVMKPIIDATLSTPPRGIDADDAADQRQRQVQHHEQRIACPPEGEHEDHEESRNHRDAEDQQAL